MTEIRELKVARSRAKASIVHLGMKSFVESDMSPAACFQAVTGQISGFFGLPFPRKGLVRDPSWSSIRTATVIPRGCHVITHRIQSESKLQSLKSSIQIPLQIPCSTSLSACHAQRFQACRVGWRNVSNSDGGFIRAFNDTSIYIETSADNPARDSLLQV